MENKNEFDFVLETAQAAKEESVGCCCRALLQNKNPRSINVVVTNIGVWEGIKLGIGMFIALPIMVFIFMLFFGAAIVDYFL